MIQIRDSVDGQFFCRIVSANGKILAHSETFKKKVTAENNAKALASLTKMKIVDKTKSKPKK